MRERFMAVCMEGSEAWERKIMYTFAGHVFDWRWGTLEEVVWQLRECLPILDKYWDFNKLSKDGEIAPKTLEHVKEALEGGQLFWYDPLFVRHLPWRCPRSKLAHYVSLPSQCR